MLPFWILSFSSLIVNESSLLALFNPTKIAQEGIVQISASNQTASNQSASNQTAEHRKKTVTEELSIKQVIEQSSTEYKSHKRSKAIVEGDQRRNEQNDRKPAASIKTEENAEATIDDLLGLGSQYIASEDYEKAIATYQNALTLIEVQPSIDIHRQSEALAYLGVAYQESNQYQQAISTFETAISLFTPSDHSHTTNLATSDYAEILIWLTTELGIAHNNLSHFGTALEYHQQLTTADTFALLPDNPARIEILTRKGILETEIGQYTQAEATLQTAVELSQQNNKPQRTADAIAALGWTYEQQNNPQQAIAQYHTALTHYQQTNSTHDQILMLSNLSTLHLEQNDTSAAQTVLDQALKLSRTLDHTQSRTLSHTDTFAYEQTVLFNNLGTLSQIQSNNEQAWQNYRQALRLSRQSNDKVSEIRTNLNLGQLIEAENQPELAIFFYKTAIAHIETIRQNIQTLPTAAQKRYILTIEDTYRYLADLLLQQNRTPEALEILELLKLQEITAYLNSTQPQEAAHSNNLLSPEESDLAITFNTLPTNTTLAEFINLPEAQTLIPTAVPSTEPRSTSPQPTEESATIQTIQTILRTQPTNTAAIYPLILEDRLEIVLITAQNDPVHYPQPVTQTELSQTIHTLQRHLRASAITPTTEAQQLYTWLIQPLELALAQQQIENIIYLPDGILRYIPIAALHDGNQWFTEKYQSHNITATSIDKLNRTNHNNPSVLAGAFTDTLSPHTIQIGQQQYYYPGLPAARREINHLQTAIPNTTALFDRDFSPQNTLSKVDNHQIVHFATHANFLPGQPESSFLLFGDGSTANMRDIGQWQLPNIDLVVFSACQTALSVEGDGKELLGLGFQIQQTGAGAAIATLWAVDDTATAALMNQFYTALSQGQTKAKALRHAQQQLIDSQSFNHPHYWAAFILIGNGL